MKINEAGLDLLKEFEGLRLTAYKDIGGIWTIGYGHTGGYIHDGMEITEGEALELLEQDLEGFEQDVDKAVTYDISPNQFSALVCICYNIGTGNFRNSTLLKLLNRGEIKSAAKEFTRWSYVKGKIIPGLLRRRIAEQTLFLT